MKETVAVVYSKSQNSLHLAQKYALEHDADLVEIKTKRSFEGIFGYISLGYYAVFHKPVALKKDNTDYSNYWKVMLFAPIHAGRVAAPARSFMFEKRSSLKDVGLVLSRGDKENTYQDACERLEKELMFKFSSFESHCLDQ